MTEVAMPLKVPKNAPSWAIGITSVLISLGICIVTIYVTARPEISQYVTETNKVVAKKADLESELLTKVLDLVTSNTKQITILSQAVVSAQDTNSKLTERIGSVEKELAVVKTLLSKCESDLSSKVPSRRTP